MARFVVGAVFGAAVVLIGGAALGLHADESSVDVREAAAAAGVDERDLQGAINSLESAGKSTDPYSYLRSDGKLPPLPPSVAASPPAPTSGARVACIEAKESQGFNVANRRGSGAVGVLQYMVPTFQSHAAEMGHTDWSPWNPDQARAVAAHDLAMGRRSQWTVGGC